MNFQKENKNNYTIINVYTEKLDASNSSELKSELVLLNKNSVNQIIINLEKTKYCDSSGLSAILIGNRLCKDASGVFVVCGLQPNVEKLIQISQLDKVLHIGKSLKDAENLVANQNASEN